MSEDNFSMSSEKYLAKYHIGKYLEDSIQQLLEHREVNPKVIPAKFFLDYLQDGKHVMFREFSFIRSTPHNRASFVVLFWKCFKQIGKKGDLLSIQDYSTLVGLLCPDFPFQLIQKTARIVLQDDAVHSLFSFTDFMYAFQVQFYYEEFLEKSEEIYHNQLQAVNSPREPVIVPTSGDSDIKVHQNSHLPSDGVDAMHFFRALYPLIGRSEYSTPPDKCFQQILFSAQRVSFYDFISALAQSEAINAYIGYLPEKSKLLNDSDSDFNALGEIFPMYGGLLLPGSKPPPHHLLNWMSKARGLKTIDCTVSRASRNPRSSSLSRPSSAIRLNSDSTSSPAGYTNSQQRPPPHHKRSLGQQPGKGQAPATSKKAVVDTDSDSDSDTATDSTDTN